MLRVYCLQQWYNLSDPGAEEALYDIHSMRAFCGLELGRNAIPDETTILNFRHLLERHDLTKAVFAAVAEHLEARGALLRGGTIVDATLIAGSPSTKNREGKRDPRCSVTETLELIPRRWKVIQHVREKFTCRDCEKISEAPAPFHVIARGWAGPSFAHRSTSAGD